MPLITTREHPDVHDCPCCSPHALTVGTALVAMDIEDVQALYGTLRYRPHHSESRELVLIDTFVDEVVLRWGGAEAQEFLDELLHGPYAAHLVLRLLNGDEAIFTGGHLVALAEAFRVNLEAITKL